MSRDIYSEILDIPPGDRPPDYYQLLGLEELDADPESVQGALLERSRLIRQWALSEDLQERVEELLNEVHRAAYVLGDPERKRRYDARMAGEPEPSSGQETLPEKTEARRQAGRSAEPPPVTESDGGVERKSTGGEKSARLEKAWAALEAGDLLAAEKATAKELDGSYEHEAHCIQQIVAKAREEQGTTRKSLASVGACLVIFVVAVVACAFWGYSRSRGKFVERARRHLAESGESPDDLRVLVIEGYSEVLGEEVVPEGPDSVTRVVKGEEDQSQVGSNAGQNRVAPVIRQRLTQALQSARWEEVLECVREHPSALRPTDAELRVEGAPALHAAAAEGKTQILQLLAKRAENLDFTHGYREVTALHAAVDSGQAESVKILLGAGIDADKGDREDRTPLHLATKDGRRTIVQVLLAAGADPNLKDAGGNCVMHAAAKADRKGIIEDMVEMEADLKITNRVHQTPVEVAVEADAPGALVALAEAGADLNGKNRYGVPLLKVAISEGRTNALGALLENGVNVNLQDARGCTPLHWAVYERNPGAVRALIDHGAARGEPDENGRTALYKTINDGEFDLAVLLIPPEPDSQVMNASQTSLLAAACKRDAERSFVKRLIKAGAELKETDDGISPLAHRVAEKYWSTEWILFLMNEGVDPNVRDNAGRNLLHVACRRGEGKTVEVLLNATADVDCRDDQGKTPLHLATRENHPAVVDLLLKNGAGVNMLDDYQMTPLDEAQTPIISRLLIQNGGSHGRALHERNEELLGQLVPARQWSRIKGILKADRSLRNWTDSQGRSVLYWAALYGKRDLSEWLLEEGASEDRVDRTGRTPLHAAAYAGHGPVVRLLVRHGADANRKDHRHKTPLRYARERGHTDVVQVLETTRGGRGRGEEQSRGADTPRNPAKFWFGPR